MLKLKSCFLFWALGICSAAHVFLCLFFSSIITSPLPSSKFSCPGHVLSSLVVSSFGLSHLSPAFPAPAAAPAPPNTSFCPLFPHCCGLGLPPVSSFPFSTFIPQTDTFSPDLHTLSARSPDGLWCFFSTSPHPLPSWDDSASFYKERLHYLRHNGLPLQSYVQHWTAPSFLC